MCEVDNRSRVAGRLGERLEVQGREVVVDEAKRKTDHAGTSTGREREKVRATEHALTREGWLMVREYLRRMKRQAMS